MVGNLLTDWLLQQNRLVTSLRVHLGPINCFAFNYDSSLLASAGEYPLIQFKSYLSLAGVDKAVRVWDIAFNNDGSLLASGGEYPAF